MFRLKNTLTTLAFTVFSISFTQAQNICLGTDATICAGDQVTLEDCGSFAGGATGVPYTLSQIPYNPDPFGAPGTVSLTDDSFSGVIPIGFNFCFYGTTHTQLVISSNNYVSFDLGNANGYSPWQTVPIADAGINQAHNAIMAPWQDINPGIGGSITYATYGTAPNRRFVVTWNNVPMFSCTGTLYSSQIKIFEGSNEIETHIVDKQICNTWNSGNAVHGVHSPLGLDALTVAGRNNTQWSVVNEGYLWTPQLSVQWVDTQGNTWPYTGPTLTVTPMPIPPSDSVGYFLEAIDNCGTGLGSSDTTWITVTQAGVMASMTPDLCTSNIGTVTATITSGAGPFVYEWPTLGANTPTVNNVGAGNYTVNVTDANGCTASASILVTDTPALFQGSTTLITCGGGNDGTAFAEMIPPLGNITYQWDDPNLQTTQTATGLAAGQYTCTVTSDIGCSGNVVVDVQVIPPLTVNISSQTDVTCNSANDGMITLETTLGTAPYSYVWNNSISTTNIANDLYVGPHQIIITDANGCSVTLNGTLSEPAPLDITFVTPNTQICPEDKIMLNVTGSGGSSPYTYTWSQGGNAIGTGDQITVDPATTSTEYCVVLSEACGSPTDEECVIITFPTPIEPNAVPDLYEKCVPSPFEFTNTSTNGGEIATAYWDFGTDEYIVLENGNDSTSLFFDDVGTYDLIMTVTSIYGCVYTDTVFDIILVKPRPTADFNFSSNPATIFETTVTMQDKSSSDVVDWSWNSPYSTPTQSNLTNPTFFFPEGIVGQYPVTLFVETELGCIDSITYTMNIVEDVLFYAPNTFTPDGDEFNQTWKAEISGIDEFNFELIIFNRWGQIIWESRDPNVGWDGTHNGEIVQDGTYAWIARVGVRYSDDKLEFNGSINLIR
jgi:gliding motility-associated-like protein